MSHRGTTTCRAADTAEFGQLRTDMREGFVQLRAEMTALKSEVIKWVFLF